MDTWKYYDITHTFHTLMNPQSVEKIDELIGFLHMEPESTVLDVGCGKGEFLRRLANAVTINAIGVDLSPYTIAEAKERTKDLANESAITYVEADGKEFVSAQNSLFDLSICMGASWIFGDHRGTLEALKEITKDKGLIVVGEPYWKASPSDWYLKISEIKEDDFLHYHENIEVGEELGLRPVYTLDSSLDDWDRYEWLQSLATDHYLLEHPSDPDNEELRTKVEKYRQAYVKEGRNIFGWAIYVFRKM